MCVFVYYVFICNPCNTTIHEIGTFGNQTCMENHKTNIQLRVMYVCKENGFWILLT